MDDFGSWTHSCRCYEQLKPLKDMNESACELRALDSMNSLGMWMTWTTPGHEPKALDAMNNTVLWMIWMTQVHKLKALFVVNS